MGDCYIVRSLVKKIDLPHMLIIFEVAIRWEWVLVLNLLSMYVCFERFWRNVMQEYILY